MPATETTTRTRDVAVIYRCKACKLARRVVYATTTQIMRGEYLGRFFSRTDTVSMIAQNTVEGVTVEKVGPRYPLVLTCSCGRRMTSAQVVGRRNDDIKCTARCVAAVGHDCECSCAGKNHGQAHGG